MPESETQARPAAPGGVGSSGRQPYRGLTHQSHCSCSYELERFRADLARVTVERDSLIERRHEVQLAADARYSEAMRELRDWHRWQEVRQQANEWLKEPGIVYQSAYVQAVVTDLIAERDRAKEIADATRRCEMSQWFSGGCPCEGHAALDRQTCLDVAQQEAHA